MRKDLVIDFETIGQNTMKCPAVDAAWVTFYWDRFLNEPYSFEELVQQVRTIKFSVKDQLNNYDCSFSKDDLKWWDKQSVEARKKLSPSREDLTYQEFSSIFFEYLREEGKIEYWWSRGNTFDPVLLERIMASIDQSLLMNEYLKWWRVRDIRTWIDAKFNFTTRSGFTPVANETYWNETFISHDSSHDVAADVMRLQAICRAENDMEMVDK